MIEVTIFKLETSGLKCNNSKCKRLPEYTAQIIGDNYVIKNETIVATIWLDGHQAIYCRDCIDQVYQKIKSKMDSKLWSFQ